VLFEFSGGEVPFDFHSQRNQFLMLKYQSAVNPQNREAVLHVIVNWFDQLRQRVPLDEVE
jgi:hypothetical protein